MSFYRNHRVERAYLDRVKQYLLGEIELPASKLDSRPPGIHQSNLNDNSCILKGYYSAILPQQELTDEASMRFLYGRAIERVIAFSGELDPIKKDDIWVTPDDLHPEFGLTEIKSTTSSSLMDVNAEQPQWICQLKNECYAYGTNKVNLVIFYLVGTMPSYTFWGRKDLKPDTVYKGVDLHAWTYEFTAEELKMNWLTILDRRDILLRAIEENVPIHRDVVLAELPYTVKKGNKVYWQCRKCDFSEHCYLYDNLVLDVK